MVILPAIMCTVILMRNSFRLFLALAALFLLGQTNQMQATEGGAGVYLNGFTGFMAGVVPPPGTYVTNYVYHYSGDAGADLEIPIVGSVEIAEPRATLWSGLVVPKLKI